MSKYTQLYTEAGEHIPAIPWDTYPRPQLKRESFLCLNGAWEFATTESETETPCYDRTIRVPFSPESVLSGIGETFPDEPVFWYRRTVVLPIGFIRDRVLLHFGAVDQCATVFVNGTEVGNHDGGYEAFTVDVTDVLQEENTVIVRVSDRLSDGVFPYGKQCHHRGGMWYTPTSGIWQTVWMESVSDEYVRRLRITPEADRVTIQAEGVDHGEITVQTPNGTQTVPLVNGTAIVVPSEVRCWSPEDPYLYEFTLKTTADEVRSYFALRTIDTRVILGIPRLCLNGKPYFFHGLLDQGYWSDGGMTPAAPVCYEQDILAMKSLGFNTLRKHIKVEPEQFYYDCDRLGMIVFQDMVNNSEYSFFRDTALPTVGLLRRDDRRMHRDPASRRAFEQGMEQTVQQLYNHPCVCYWTIFNEGWGQFCSSAMYHRLREWDTTRIIDSTSGWFLGGKSDVDSRHVYFRKLRLRVGNKPLVLSEFGGYTFKPEGHVFNTEKTYGYGHCETREELVAAIRRLYTEQVLPLVSRGLSAAIYTQVSDIEDETNGLVSYDRRCMKLLPDEFADVSQQLCDEGCRTP